MGRCVGREVEKKKKKAKFRGKTVHFSEELLPYLQCPCSHILASQLGSRSVKTSLLLSGLQQILSLPCPTMSCHQVISPPQGVCCPRGKEQSPSSTSCPS